VTVHYATFDSNNTLEGRMLAGHSGYDVVFPSGAHLESMTAAGVFRPLDKALLPNFKNLDPVLMQRLIPERAKSQEFERLQTRVWTRFRTGH
jgi:spermidine/putrescine-binding protein